MGGFVQDTLATFGLGESQAEEEKREKAEERATQMGEKSVELFRERDAEAKKNREAATALAKEGREKAEKRSSEFESIYGSMENNLADYYNNLTPERATSLGLQNQQRESSAALVKIRQSLAQRGLSGGGAEAALVANVALQGAEKRAFIRDTAEERVSQQKLGFLKFGMGQQQFRQGLEANARIAEQNLTAGFAAPPSNIYIQQQQLAQQEATSRRGQAEKNKRALLDTTMEGGKAFLAS